MPAFGQMFGAPPRPPAQTQFAGTTLPNYGDANQTQAALTRMDFTNWITTFMPYQDKLIEYATNQELPGLAMAQAQTDVNQAFDQQQGDLERKLRPYGPLAADEQQSADRTLALSRSAASAGAANRARDVTKARQQAILGNPTMGGIY